MIPAPADAKSVLTDIWSRVLRTDEVHAKPVFAYRPSRDDKRWSWNPVSGLTCDFMSSWGAHRSLDAIEKMILHEATPLVYTHMLRTMCLPRLPVTFIASESLAVLSPSQCMPFFRNNVFQNAGSCRLMCPWPACPGGAAENITASAADAHAATNNSLCWLGICSAT